ncbi:hypothetical protein [Borreliella garinii]|uniref:Uncharacterized protein n=1 Tax=Borreliella garinii PBr TaxID=498743 RepID=B8F1Z1_BORGR|nr:hypothetical protein [Borreliella garinii]ACL34927.1 hypothetical protein BGAPBR_Aa0022 [Borreliella garinii PBr]
MNNLEIQELLKKLIAEKLPTDNQNSNAASKQALLRLFVNKMFEFSNSNVLATSLHVFRMFFAVFEMSEAEDLVLDIINKEKLIIGNNTSTGFVKSCSYTEEEINKIITKGEL